MKILFLTPYPLNESPSQRFRFEQYFTTLTQNNIQYSVKSFLKSNNWKVFFEKGKYFSKAMTLLGGFAGRIGVLFEVWNYDFVFIHREATPIGQPIFEWIIAKVFKRRIIYDFDDAIWLTDKTNESQLEKIIRTRSKVARICRWSYKVSAGNQYLADFARAFNKNVIINPTTIDLDNVHSIMDFQKTRLDKIIVGWTGSHSTLKYLRTIEKTLQHVEEKYPSIEIWIIADKIPDLKLSKMHFKRWSLTTEISDLAQFDIGIMPLPDDEWTKGKCGFKALQYMALEIPTIASPVGVNTTIISDGVNGYLAKNLDQWEELLSLLIENQELRKQLGSAGKKTVEKHFSVRSNEQNFLSLFA